MKPVKWAPNVYKRLNGVFCIYKQRRLASKKALEHLRKNLCSDLNALPCYRHEFEEAQMKAYPLPHVANTQEKSLVIPKQLKEDLTEHRLVLGQRYITDDFDINYLHGLDTHSSGVMLVGIGNMGMELLGVVARAKFLRVYQVKGTLGYSTQNYYDDGIFVERASFKHISKAKMDKICSAIQSSHQGLMFQFAGVDQDSEEAYRLASGGMVRPVNTQTPPILYSVKCIHFEPPDFTLEIHAINEKCWYLAELIHDIGQNLKSAAVCNNIYRIRYGRFTRDHALLKKDWKVTNIEKNIRMLKPFFHPNKIMTQLTINDRNETLDESLQVNDEETEDLIRRAVKENFDD